MLLLAQVALTVWACIRLKKAGKSWGLGVLPMVVTAFLGVLSGFANTPTSAIFLLDCACVVALGIIIFMNKENV